MTKIGLNCMICGWDRVSSSRMMESGSYGSEWLETVNQKVVAVEVVRAEALVGLERSGFEAEVVLAAQ